MLFLEKVIDKSRSSEEEKTEGTFSVKLPDFRLSTRIIIAAMALVAAMALMFVENAYFTMFT